MITPIFTALEKTKWGKKILEVGSFIKSKIAAFFQGVKGFFKKAPKLPKLGKIRTALEKTFPNIKKFFDGIGTVITKVNAFFK